MAYFCTAEQVRFKCQTTDATEVPTALIDDCIAEVHGQILMRLNPMLDLESPPEALETGEALLAGACLMRRLAAKNATTKATVVVGGQRLELGKQFEALLSMWKGLEEEAWQILAPYLNGIPRRSVGITTDSVPVLGESG